MSTTTAIPTTQNELEEYLSDSSKIQAAMKDGTFKDVVKNYARALYNKDQSIRNQIDEQVQAVMRDWLKTNAKEHNLKPANRVDMAHNKGVNTKYAAAYNKRADGAGLDGKFSDVGEFLQTAWFQNVKNPSGELRAKLEILNAYQEKVPSDGGFLVPEEFRSELLRLSLETGIIRPRARVIPMQAAKLNIPFVDSTTNVGSVYGGIQTYWTEEGAELTESQAKFGRVKLEPWKLTALAHVTNELVRDAAGGFGMYIEQMFPEAMAFAEDYAFINGTGVGQPLGILNAANGATVTVSKESSQAAATIKWNNIVKMYSRMLPSSLGRAVWLVAPNAFAQLALMQTVVTNVAGNENVGGSAVWLPDAHGTPQLTLLGRPVIMTEKVPAGLGTKGDINFVDPAMYLIGDRQRVEVDSSPHVRFTSDQTTYRIISRVDGRPWMQSAITPAYGGDTMSAFVTLETRS